MGNEGGRLPRVHMGDETAERLEALRVAQAARFVERTGLCAVCQSRPACIGMTCGAESCRVRWLFPAGLPNGGGDVG